MAEATLALSAEQNLVFHVPAATVLRGGTLSKQGQREDGMDQMHQGLTAIQADGSTVFRPLFLALLWVDPVSQIEKCCNVGSIKTWRERFFSYLVNWVKP